MAGWFVSPTAEKEFPWAEGSGWDLERPKNRTRRGSAGGTRPVLSTATSFIIAGDSFVGSTPAQGAWAHPLGVTLSL